MNPSAQPSRPFIYHFLAMLGVVILAVLMGTIVWRAFDVLLVIFAGILLGVFLYSLSHKVSDYLPIGYAWCLLLVTVLIFGGMAVLSYFLVPPVVDRISQLTQQLGDAAGQIRQQLQQSSWGQQLLDRTPYLDGMLSGRGGQAGQGGESGQGGAMSTIGTMLQTTFGAIVNVVVIFFLGIYTAATPAVYRRGLVKLVPPYRRERASEVLSDLRVTLWRWTLGRLFSMSVIGVATAIGLWLMGVPLPTTMGIIAALLTFVPNIGPVLSVVPPLLLAVPQGMTLVVYVVVFYLVLQLAESYLLTPLVQRYEVSLPPALPIAVQLLMSVLAGVLGLALATPLAAAVIVLVNDLYIHDVLKDPES